MERSKEGAPPAPTYLITKDLVETLRYKYGIILPQSVDTKVNQLGDEFIKNFWQASGLPSSIGRCELEASQLSSRLSSLLQGDKNAYLSLDRVYVPFAPAYLEVTRLTDPNTGKVEISERPGSRPILEQIAKIESNRIALADVGTFKGETLLRIMEMLEGRRISVTGIYLGVSNYQIEPRLNTVRELRVVKRFNFYEWIELRAAFRHRREECGAECGRHENVHTVLGESLRMGKHSEREREEGSGSVQGL